MKRFLGVLFLLSLFLLPRPIKALNTVHFYLFYGDGCPHCAEEEEWLKEMEEKYDNLVIHRYETWYDVENQNLMIDLKTYLGESIEKPKSVPFSVIGEDTYIGFGASLENSMEDSIITYSYRSYEDKIDAYLNENDPVRVGEDLKDLDAVEELKGNAKVEKDNQFLNEKVVLPLLIVGGACILVLVGAYLFYLYYNNTKKGINKENEKGN